MLRNHVNYRLQLETMYVTSLYAGVFGLFFVALSVRTLLLRRRFGVGIGSGDQPVLERASRVHSNFAEYVPLSLILIYFLEIQMSPKLWIHLICIALLVGRMSHAYGVSQVKENLIFRVTGMALTFTVMISTSIRLMMAHFQTVS